MTETAKTPTTKIESARHGAELEFPQDEITGVQFNQVVEADFGDARGRSDDFVPHRIVANLDVQHVDEELEDPIFLRVYFSFEDLKHLPDPKLAYWKDHNDDGDFKWRLFNDLGTINRFPLPGNLLWAGYLEVKFINTAAFNTMGDPPIAVGR